MGRIKLYRVEKDRNGEVFRVSWIRNEGEGFKQSHVGIEQSISEDSLNAIYAVLKSLGYKHVDNFDEVSNIILKNAGLEVVSQ